MGIKALYRDDYPVHLLVKVPNLASKILLDAYGKNPAGLGIIDWLNQNAPGWELCYLSSRPVTFQVDEFPDDLPARRYRFHAPEASWSQPWSGRAQQ